jgi:RNA polymerase sigma-70 factor (ECF subfamily)
MPALIPIFLTPANAKLLEALWNDHSGAVHAMLIAYCGNPSDAGDILQDLFLRLSRDPSTLATMKSPRAFLIVSARRLAIDLARKRSAELRRQESPEAIDNFHPAPSTPLADKDLANIINAALQKLPTDQRSVIKSKMIEGKTLAAIAEEQGIPLNTVASRLRYSLDKLRNELRPHYEHMKNPNAHSSNSSERLIKPLEPKRVPSVAPGLEGVAAMAIDDFEDNSVFLPPEETSSSGDIETAGCDPGGNAWENVFTPIAVELPQDDTENTGEPDIIIEDITDFELVDNEHLATDESLEIVPTGEFPEVVICELPPSVVENIEEPIIITCEPFPFLETVDLPVENPESIDFSELNTQEILEQIFEGELEIVDETSDGNAEDKIDLDENEDLSLSEYNDYLQTEYDIFLTVNPDWITENSGGDIQAQVITPSQYAEIEFSDPGAAQSFDVWFYNNYIAPYENLEPVEGGMLNLAGQPHDYGTLLTTDQPDRTGIPEAWWRGGNVQLSGDSEIAYKAGTVSFDQESTPLVVADRGTLDENQQVTEKFTAQEEASILANNQTFAPDSYQFTTDVVDSSQENNTSTETPSGEAVSKTAIEQSVSHVIQPSPFSSVVPIVSGSEEAIDSVSKDQSMFTENTKTSFAAVDLPILVETKTALAPEESHMSDDIVFVDEAPAAPHDQQEIMESGDLSASIATQAASAALTGAFVLGSTTQTPSVRGNPSRFSKSL